MRDKKTDKAIMEFVKLTIKNPEILDNREKAKDTAYAILKNNKEEDISEKDRA